MKRMNQDFYRLRRVIHFSLFLSSCIYSLLQSKSGYKSNWRKNLISKHIIKIKKNIQKLKIKYHSPYFYLIFYGKSVQKFPSFSFSSFSFYQDKRRILNILYFFVLLLFFQIKSWLVIFSNYINYLDEHLPTTSLGCNKIYTFTYKLKSKNFYHIWLRNQRPQLYTVVRTGDKLSGKTLCENQFKSNNDDNNYYCTWQNTNIFHSKYQLFLLYTVLNLS